MTDMLELPPIEEEQKPPPPSDQTAWEWMRRNLFNSWYNTLLTIVFGILIAWGLYLVLRFVFVTANWGAVRTNLTLFMQGTFPRDEQWRLVAQLLFFGAFIGWSIGVSSASRRDRAEEAGLVIESQKPIDVVKRFWSVILFVIVILSFAGTVNPWLFAIGTVLLGVGAFYVAKRLPRGARLGSWLIAALLLIGAFQVVIGTTGTAWIPTALVAAVGGYSYAERWRSDSVARSQVIKIIGAVVAAAVVYGLYQVFSFDGVGWDDWGGLQLTLLASIVATVLAFPLGLLLALGRRSSLPAIRWMSTTYIELIRGVPLISLLLMAAFFLGFFLSARPTLSDLTRAIIAMTLFTAAYIAEIVRGGLQSIPAGQTEAGQSLGLSVTAVMRMIILPQALRAVIPAMVGQFISLFKDTSLLSIIGIAEFLQVRDLVHAQADFRGQGIAETLIFVAFGYWAFAYAMSKESQVLERRLGVGER